MCHHSEIVLDGGHVTAADQSDHAVIITATKYLAHDLHTILDKLLQFSTQLFQIKEFQSITFSLLVLKLLIRTIRMLS